MATQCSSPIYDAFFDESCHLEHDGNEIAVFGLLWAPHEAKQRIAKEIRRLKVQHRLRPETELKWTKVATGKLDLYRAVLNLFFDEPDLHYRAVVATQKTTLRHDEFSDSHNQWYYKMIWQTVEPVLAGNGAPRALRLYLDYKDREGALRVHELERVLRSASTTRSIQDVQQVRSDEVEQLQLCDVVTGALSYGARQLGTSTAKLDLANHFFKRANVRLGWHSPKNAEKINVFWWAPR